MYKNNYMKNFNALIVMAFILAISAIALYMLMLKHDLDLHRGCNADRRIIDSLQLELNMTKGELMLYKSSDTMYQRLGDLQNTVKPIE